jgi:CheY-like chemotaxis protein
MTRLLDDLLDVSRITRGKIKFRRERVDLATVVENAIEASRPLIDGRRHRLHLVVPKHAPSVDGDGARLLQMVTNLLNNAAKYTPEGGRIELRVAQRDGVVEIRVSDSGIGIPQAMLPRIFDLFVQTDRGASEVQEGLGIGLTLVRVIAMHHGGSVEAHSDGVGSGSEFIVRLPPSAPDADAVEPVDAQGVASPHVPRKRIVIVDDNRDSSESLATLLRLSGHEVSIATDGISAIHLVQTLRPDLAVLDIGLPGMNGYEVARRLRQSGCRVRLAAVTGYGTPEDSERSREAGFDHHFVKPIEIAVLEQLIAEPANARSIAAPA